MYKIGSVIRVKSQEEGPVPFDYVTIHRVFVYKDYKIFMGKKVTIIKFDEHLRAIELVLTENSSLSLSTQLYSHGVLHLKQKEQRYYVVEKDNWVKPSLFY